ncbi:MAG: hypothetical protein JO199_04815, partial [Candidatus Eremiobacteraeota bacterium]|nr:hypothetical protein [Candidatus Eremiobacteraeota bacterium]
MANVSLTARILTCTLALALACVARSLAAAPIQLTPSMTKTDLLSQATFADGSIPFADLQSRRVPFVPFASFRPHGWPVQVWVRFSLTGVSLEDAPSWYVMLPRWTESATLYRANYPAMRTSMYVPFSKRPVIGIDNPAFPLLERDDENGPLLLHLTYYPDTDLSLWLITEEGYAQQTEPTLLIEALFFGVLLAVGILNL